MEKTFLARENLHKRAELKDGNNLSVINCSDLRNCAYAVNPCESLVHALLVVAEDVNNTLADTVVLLLGDGYDCAGLALNLLDDLTAFTDDCTDKLTRYTNLDDARNEWLVVLTRLADGLHHLAHDVHTTLTRLLERLCKHLV